MILIYGNGKFLKNKSKQIDWSQVAAIIDKNATPNEKYHQVDVLKPKQIHRYDFHAIFIFSNIYFEEIKCELIYQHDIHEKIIFSWKCLLEDAKDIFSLELPFFKKIIEEYKINSILDLNFPRLSKYILTKSNLHECNLSKIDGFYNTTLTSNQVLYDDIYSSANELSKAYDLALILEWNNQIDASYPMFCNHVKYILVYLTYNPPYDVTWQQNLKHISEKLSEVASVKTYFTECGLILIAKSKSLTKIDFDLHIFVVLHKKFKVMSDETYRPICVGNSYKNASYLDEHIGENIAHLNSKINECTAIYWIWKNTNSAYVGLNHYRRYFYHDDLQFKGNYLTKEKTQELLHSYNLILAKSNPFPICVREQLKGTIEDKELFDLVYNRFYEEIKLQQNNYADAFLSVMNGNNFFRCNIFVTKRSIFNKYCEWLFSFLLPIAEEIDLSKYKGIDSRIIGYFAERMLTVFLFKQDYSLIELPYTDIF